MDFNLDRDKGGEPNTSAGFRWGIHGGENKREIMENESVGEGGVKAGKINVQMVKEANLAEAVDKVEWEVVEGVVLVVIMIEVEK